MQAAPVKEEPVGALVGGEEQVDFSVVVEVAGAHAAAVVVIHVIEYIECAGGVRVLLKSMPVRLLSSASKAGFSTCGRMPAGRNRARMQQAMAIR